MYKQRLGGDNMEPVQNTGNENLKGIAKGVLISICTTIIACLIFAVILTYTNISEDTITPVIIMITAISIFIGSTIGNAKIQKNGLVNGAGVGLIYIIAIYLISSIINGHFTLNIASIIMIVLSIVFGILGGIIAVNKK